MKRVYLDYAATTPVRPEVVEVMKPYWTEKFGNPSSLHSFGQEARQAVEQAREQIAGILACLPEEIFFTGTTTTSDNLAILGAARAAKKKNRGDHLITSSVEHHAVLDTCRVLEKEGFRLTILPVNKFGEIDPGQVEKAIDEKTVLVTIMYANNEMGTIQPIKEISQVVKKKGVLIHTDRPGSGLLVHTDAAATVEYLDLKLENLGVDLMTIGAHKFGGPKGVGILYLKKGVEVEPVTFGGHHERGLWPGTEAVPLIVGMAEALGLAVSSQSSAVSRVTKLGDKLIKGVLEKIPETILTGHPEKRLADIASFCFKGAEGEAILLRLDAEGIAASSGSACTSGTLEPSHVLLAMGIPPEIAHGSIRFSLGRETTEEEIDYVLKVLPKIIDDIRKMAPKF